MYLVGNGFKVIRYDHTNHVGISYGEHKGFKLSKMYEDFDSVFNYIKSGRFIFNDEYEFAKEKYVLPDSKHQLNKNP